MLLLHLRKVQVELVNTAEFFCRVVRESKWLGHTMKTQGYKTVILNTIVKKI